MFRSILETEVNTPLFEFKSLLKKNGQCSLFCTGNISCFRCAAGNISCFSHTTMYVFKLLISESVCTVHVCSVFIFTVTLCFRWSQYALQCSAECFGRSIIPYKISRSGKCKNWRRVRGTLIEIIYPPY